MDKQLKIHLLKLIHEKSVQRKKNCRLITHENKYKNC